MLRPKQPKSDKDSVPAAALRAFCIRALGRFLAKNLAGAGAAIYLPTMMDARQLFFDIPLFLFFVSLSSFKVQMLAAAPIYFNNA